MIIWDVATGEQKARLKGHARGVTSVAWGPDGTQVASGSRDSTAIVWDAAPRSGEQTSEPKGALELGEQCGVEPWINK